MQLRIVKAIFIVLLLIGGNAQAKEILLQSRQSIVKAQVGVGAGVNTNPFFQTNDNVKTEFALQLQPSVFADLHAKNSEFKFEANSDLRILPVVRDALVYQSQLMASGDINKDGPWSFNFKEQIRQSRIPTEIFVGLTNVLYNRSMLGFGYHSKGHSVFVDVSGTYGIDRWLDQADNSLTNLDNNYLYLQARVGWKLIPRWVFYIDGVFGRYWLEKTEEYATPLWLYAGATFQLSEHISSVAQIGYSNPMPRDRGAVIVPALGLDRLTGKLEAEWKTANGLQIAGGGVRDAVMLPIFGYALDNKFYVRADYKIGNKVAFSLAPHVSFLQFGVPLEMPIDLERRFDIEIGILANTFYAFNDWLSVGVTYQGTVRLTNSGSSLLGGNSSSKTLFNAHEAMIMAQAAY